MPRERQITKRHRDRFQRACQLLKDLMDEIQEFNPQAMYYMQEDTLNMMKGPTHDERQALQENVVDDYYFPGADAGAW